MLFISAIYLLKIPHRSDINTFSGFPYFKQHLKGSIISLGETKNLAKINLYRNIIKNFSDIEEIEEKFDDVGNRYFLYRIS